MESRQPPAKGEVAAQVLSLLVMVALQAWCVWVMLPAQQRFWIRLAVAGRVRSAASRTALALGYQGMGEELRTGQRSLRYLAAWSLSTVRDQANRQIEAMRP